MASPPDLRPREMLASSPTPCPNRLRRFESPLPYREGPDVHGFSLQPGSVFSTVGSPSAFCSRAIRHASSIVSPEGVLL